MGNAYEILKGVPFPSSGVQTGLTQTIRQMGHMDAIVVPANKQSSVHPCAAAAGAKVKTHRNADGTVTVWRVDRPVATGVRPAVAEESAPAAAVSQSKAGAGNGRTVKAQSGHFVEQPYGPTIFVTDNPVPTGEKGIFG